MILYPVFRIAVAISSGVTLPLLYFTVVLDVLWLASTSKIPSNNTYKYEGVPPGPICMPDMSSIISVLNPEKHDYYFFVVDVENFGYHVFASSLEEHNRNKKKYVHWINKQGIFR